MRRAIRVLCAFVLVGALFPSAASASSAKAVPPTDLGKPTSLVSRQHSSGESRLVSPLVAGGGVASPSGVVKPADVPAVADDDIPGVVMPQSPIAGSLDSDTDTDDVYRFYLEQGARMDFSLTTGDSGTDFSIWLYGPTATSVYTSDAMGFTPGGGTYPQLGYFTAPESGYYYVDLYAYAGAGAYSFTWAKTGSPNDDISGTAITPSPVSNWLDSTFDPDDVYKISLNQGDTLSLNLSSNPASCSAGFNADLSLYGPGATSISSSPWLASSASAGYQEHIDYIVGTAGDYFADVRAIAGSGPSILSWTVTPRMHPIIARTPSASKITVKRKHGKAKYTLGARMTGGPYVLQHYPLSLQTSKNGKSGWKTVARLSTDGAGRVSRALSSKKKGTFYYRWSAPATTNTFSWTTGVQRVVVK